MNSQNTEDPFKGVGIEVDILSPENFLKIKETLTRIGIAIQDKKTLYQSAHILHKRERDTGKSRYVILHFKELFILDGKNSSLSEEDSDRRDYIVHLLESWGLLESLEEIPEQFQGINVKVIPWKEKNEWQLISKYSIGGNNGKTN